VVKERAVSKGVGKNLQAYRQEKNICVTKMIALDTHELGWDTFAFGFAIGFAKISMLAPTRLKNGVGGVPTAAHGVFSCCIYSVWFSAH
jgi:hypothetical protein